MADLETVLTVEDLHDLYEIVIVDLHNARIVKDWQDKQAR